MRKVELTLSASRVRAWDLGPTCGDLAPQTSRQVGLVLTSCDTLYKIAGCASCLEDSYIKISPFRTRNSEKPERRHNSRQRGSGLRKPQTSKLTTRKCAVAPAPLDTLRSLTSQLQCSRFGISHSIRRWKNLQHSAAAVFQPNFTACLCKLD